LAFYGILVLWGRILGTILSFWRLNRVAGVFLLPYIAWVTFEAALAFGLWQLNQAPGLKVKGDFAARRTNQNNH